MQNEGENKLIGLIIFNAPSKLSGSVDAATTRLYTFFNSICLVHELKWKFSSPLLHLCSVKLRLKLPGSMPLYPWLIPDSAIAILSCCAYDPLTLCRFLHVPYVTLV
ncbi:ribosomal protein S12 methylthiotransferase [Platysternon megacephalum]|uniref:Ribosomal protein S12 methylthiotransferase n=1 Tax=Platysternon megacephalum TaxID=55544 RepID=A0A4D9DIE3_9SAUR|nr:ribosomal protein S12 methylthiotransferase [Platysternon megacephalum]